MTALEQRSREILSTLSARANDTRAVLLARRKDRLQRLAQRIARQESRALELVTRPKWDDISPMLVRCSKADLDLWEYLRSVLSTAPWRGRPGRLLRYFAVDRNTKGIIGVADLGSEVMAMGPRDRWIGWTSDQRLAKGGLRRIVNLGTCVPTQPFGWLCGGKFIAEASSTLEVFDSWTRKYGDAPALVCTTSLYGKSSQYNRLPSWKFLGLSAGTVPHTALSDDELNLLRSYLRSIRRKTRSGGVGGFVADSAIDVVVHAASALGIKAASLGRGQQRGSYASELYDGARLDLLSGASSSKPTRTIDGSSVWWRDRWGDMRYPKVRERIDSFDFQAYSLRRIRAEWHASGSTARGERFNSAGALQ